MGSEMCIRDSISSESISKHLGLWNNSQSVSSGSISHSLASFVDIWAENILGLCHLELYQNTWGWALRYSQPVLQNISTAEIFFSLFHLGFYQTCDDAENDCVYIKILLVSTWTQAFLMDSTL